MPSNTKAKVISRLRRRVIKSFLDILILSKLEKGEPMGGYDFISFIHKKFGVLVGSGTVYSNLYALEREGFINGYSSQRKRVYKITDMGKQFADAAHEAMNTVQYIVGKILKGEV